jgi:hypothetical protein
MTGTNAAISGNEAGNAAGGGVSVTAGGTGAINNTPRNIWAER